MDWNPEQYNKFKAERSQPFFDLAAMVTPRVGIRVVDLGCGSGELTASLLRRLPRSHITGIDSSTEMLAKAKPFSNGQLCFKLGRQEQLEGEWDLIFSNAALQWSDDHPSLFPALWGRLSPGGQLCVQMPSNHQSPTHLAIQKVAQQPPFASQLGGYLRSSPVLSLEQYGQILFSLGASSILAQERIYQHVLPNAGAVLEWLRGTALLPYLDKIGSLEQLFLQHIQQELNALFQGSPVYYPFKRIFLVATKPVA